MPILHHLKHIMKITIKNKSNLVKAIILAVLFMTLHFFANFSSVPYLLNFAPQPFEWETIELKEAVFPSYLNPFRKLEYRYAEKQKNEIVLIEKAESIISHDIAWDICKLGRDILKIQSANKCMDKIREDKSGNLQISFGDPGQYYNPDIDGDFKRGFGGGDYPNWLFFIIQYLITVAFIFSIYKAITLKKK